MSIACLGLVLVLWNGLALVAIYGHDTGSVIVYVLCQGVRVSVSVLGGFYAVLYTVARVYIVVACFVNLVHLSDSAFEVPLWSKYFPHIS